MVKKSSQKTLTRNDIHIVSDDREDFQIQVVTLENLKSALDFAYEKALKHRKTCKNWKEYKHCIKCGFGLTNFMKTAFPAIYEKEKGDG